MRTIRSIGSLPQPYGAFELEELLGTGGMAEVYRARRRADPGGPPLVVKRLRPRHANDEALARLFEGEVDIVCDLNHENIVRVYERGSLDGGEPFIAMEYVEGTDLRQLLEHAVKAERPFPAWVAVRVVREVLHALSHAHSARDGQGRMRNLVHCDVTPENILISRNGGVKLTDFGVATDDTRASAPLGDQAKGKLPYMSPEQVLEQRVDARSDLFSASVVLWESLAGRRLFPGRTPSEVMAQICASPRPPASRFAPAVPPQLDTILLRALAPDVDSRYRSAEDLGRALDLTLRLLNAPTDPARFRAEVVALMDAPVVKPAASLFDQDLDEDDGHDELEALDRIHEQPDLHAPLPVRADLPLDASTPRPARLGSQEDARSTASTQPRMEAVSLDAPPPERGEGTYRIIRTPAPTADETPETANEIMRAYLEEADTSEIALGELQAPPEPLFQAVDPSGRSSGPYVPVDLLDFLSTHEHRPGPAPVRATLDGEDWISAGEIADLLGEPRLDHQNLPTEGVGRLSERSFVYVLGRLGRTESTGRLTVWRQLGADRVAIELDIKNGFLIRVSWTGAPFETWSALLEDPSLDSLSLPEVLTEALSSRTPMALLLPEDARDFVGRTRNLLARRHFESVLGWSSGKYHFDATVTVEDSAAAQPILRLLPGLVYTALEPDEIILRLPARSEAHTFVVDLATAGAPLGLTPAEADALQILGDAPSLQHAATQLSRRMDVRLVWAVAYVLTELQLLTVRGARSATGPLPGG
ncbi:MAG: serine/threonine-protein kinase [Myxococcota bacterium]